MAEFLADVASWAWARHHNVLSWYVRPLFFLPFCWFAYRRSATGMALTLVALATSMAWFPARRTPTRRSSTSSRSSATTCSASGRQPRSRCR
jgi:hypothetical protein